MVTLSQGVKFKLPKNLFTFSIDIASFQRPDNKQTFVTSWVKNYNSVAEDMREDVEMKAELHQTVEVGRNLILLTWR